MYILGLNCSHLATAALLKDGEILACASEERFTRIKNQGGFPKKSVDYCLKYAKIDASEIDLVVFNYSDPTDSYFYSKKESGKVGFMGHLKEILLRNSYSIYKFFPPIYTLIELSNNTFHFIYKNYTRNFYINILIRDYGISDKKIIFCDHHTAHVFASKYFFEMDSDALIITNDGSGDNTCGSVVSIKKNKYKIISDTPNKYSLAYVYYYTTKILGFKPNEEEYKVMGLAPYANKKIKEVDSIFNRLIFSKESTFKSFIPVWGYYGYLDSLLRNFRYDSVAAGVQNLTEELSVNQVKYLIDKTKIKTVILGGGLAMNIKANGKIAALDEVKSLYVCPSSGDESTAIGAAHWAYSEYKTLKNQQVSKRRSIYLGPRFGEEEILRYISKLKSIRVVRINKDKVSKSVAKLLSEGKIVARFSDRMEFGARALGNRSILADPRNIKVIDTLNSQIKNRDFWLPFAPTILSKCSQKYLKNPKNNKSAYMMIGFDTTNQARKDIPAAIHPADFSCRPQILEKEDNLEYYDLINEFYKLTGVGAILNTSFNLHGEPIVCTPKDAVDTFMRSNLEYLLIENYLLHKK